MILTPLQFQLLLQAVDYLDPAGFFLNFVIVAELMRLKMWVCIVLTVCTLFVNCTDMWLPSLYRLVMRFLRRRTERYVFLSLDNLKENFPAWFDRLLNVRKF